MAQFEALNTDVEVNNQTVLSIIDGLGAIKSTTEVSPHGFDTDTSSLPLICFHRMD